MTTTATNLMEDALVDLQELFFAGHSLAAAGALHHRRLRTATSSETKTMNPLCW